MTDVIVCWPKDVYYPLFVKLINECRDLFGRIIVVMTNGSTDRNYTNYIENKIKNCSIIREFEDDGVDWRNAAVKKALKYVVSNKILFIEQDFLTDRGFIESILKKSEKKQLECVAYKDGNRLHPAFLLITVNLLNKTSQDFSVLKDVGDHFYKISLEIKEKAKSIFYINGIDGYKHLAGLTQNYRLDRNFYGSGSFYNYNRACLELDMPDEWRSFIKNKMEEVLNDKTSEIYELL